MDNNPQNSALALTWMILAALGLGISTHDLLRHVVKVLAAYF
jgi:hypothetical protein